MTDSEETELTGDSDDRPKPKFEGQTVLQGDGEAIDDSNADSE